MKTPGNKSKKRPPMEENLDDWSAPLLRIFATQLQIPGRSKLRTKAALLAAIRAHLARPLASAICPHIEYDEPLPEHILATLDEIQQIICSTGLRFVLPQYREEFAQSTANLEVALTFFDRQSRRFSHALFIGGNLREQNENLPFAHLSSITATLRHPIREERMRPPKGSPMFPAPAIFAIFAHRGKREQLVAAVIEELHRRFGRQFPIILDNTPPGDHSAVVFHLGRS